MVFLKIIIQDQICVEGIDIKKRLVRTQTVDFIGVDLCSERGT